MRRHLGGGGQVPFLLENTEFHDFQVLPAQILPKAEKHSLPNSDLTIIS